VFSVAARLCGAVLGALPSNFSYRQRWAELNAQCAAVERRISRTMTAFQIRPAAPADLPAIVGLIGELAAFEHLSHLMAATPETLAPHLFGPRPVAEALVAEATEPSGASGQGSVVAFALFFTNFSTFLAQPGLYLEDLYVQPAWRGQGVGKALLQRLGALAVERGCGRFEWSVLDWNANAIRFYERMGATVMPDWRICRVTGDALARFAATDEAN
jgi:GNAT superfamily N-acetyltransferase